MNDKEWFEIQAFRGEFQRWAPVGDVHMELVFTSWDNSKDSQWIQAEDAIRRETQLLARIHHLEEHAAQAAELVSKAVEMMVPPKKSEAAHEWRGPAHDGETGPSD
jgi:hypothetical protein